MCIRDRIVICSEDTFRSITGKNAYTILDVRLKKGNGEKAAVQLRDEALKLGLNFSDSRKDKEETQAIKFSFSVFVYGFLTVILLISVLHIINNINMSVAGRMNQCGVMRAIGMEGKQLLHMVRAEAVVYALFGAAAGILKMCIRDRYKDRDVRRFIRAGGFFAVCMIITGAFLYYVHMEDIKSLYLQQQAEAAGAPVSYTHLDVYKRQQLYLSG